MRIFETSETCYRYRPVLSDENEKIAEWLDGEKADLRLRPVLFVPAQRLGVTTVLNCCRTRMPS